MGEPAPVAETMSSVAVAVRRRMISAGEACGSCSVRRAAAPVAWGAVQSALNELLVSPADKRRAGIELQAAASDPDEDAAVLQLAKYHDVLESG